VRGRRQCDSINGCGKFYQQHLANCPYCNTPEAFSDFVPFDPRDWIYDIETYPNIFTASFKHVNTGTRLIFEVSDRKNQLGELTEFLFSLKYSNCRLVGFNNIGFDYPVIHLIIDYAHLSLTVEDIYKKAASIIATPWHRRFDNVIWDSDTHIRQIDLYKVHHFDNEARSTSLKMLEFNMRSETVEDLPFPPGHPLTIDQIQTLIEYNDHDVDETEKFYIESIPLIDFRDELSAKYSRNFLNHNDTKIGKDYFIMRLEEQLPGSCYMRVDGKRHPRQTIRNSINIREVIFPYINFKTPEFERVKQWLASQIITETKGVFKGLSAEVRGFKYDFGVGGIHGSIDSAIVSSDDEYVIYDWDVASYYPNLAIVNRLFPRHLSDEFCGIYQDVFEQRRQYKKGTPENAMLKLALNGVYGDSNNKYSPFYDSQYMMSITINGQLLLCLLAEFLIDIPDLQMIQINTDGLTIRLPRRHIDQMNHICEWWQKFTCLELESAIYSRMFIRDVNNYIAEYEGGKLKNKGAYAHLTRLSEGSDWHPDRCIDWHQNHSALVIPKAAEAALVHGQDITDFITNHPDIMDFMLRTKVGRADQLIINEAGNERALQRITRYYISHGGGTLTKVSAPANGHAVGTWKRANGLTDSFYRGVIAELKVLSDPPSFVPPPAHELDTTGLPWDERINTKNKSKYEIRRTGLNVGWLATPCNDMVDAQRVNINYDYYIAEAEKLVNPLWGIK